MSIRHVVAKAQDVMKVRRVYGESYEHDGALIIPAAAAVEAAPTPTAFRARAEAGGSASPPGQSACS